MNFYRFRRVSIFLLTIALASVSFSAGAISTNYAGLVYSGNTNTGPQSGIFVMSVSANRKFNGQMMIGGRSAGFNGRFDTNGAADILVKITTDNSCYGCDPPIIDIETKVLWRVRFQLDPSGESLSGGLHFRNGGFPDGTLFGKRSSFGRANQVSSVGKFTFILAGSSDPANTNFPTGNGVGTMIVNSFGTVGISGSLADKSTFSQGTLLCDDGTFPIYDSLYGGKGMIQGWIGLTNNSDADVTGDVIWAKPDFAGRAFYPAGFTNDVPVTGSRYVRTKPVLDWTNGVVVFQGGKLSAPFTDDILLNAKGKIASPGDKTLSMKLQPSSGRFSGTVKDPSTGDRISFIGVLLQNQSRGFGYFPDAPSSGQVLLGPAEP